MALSNFTTTPAADLGQVDDPGDFHAVIVAGDPKGSPPDSPANRVDANTTTSPFASVGSLQITASSGTYICTGTPIDATHVLTAGHCVDIDDNGVPDIAAITFNLNYGGNLTSQITATAWQTHPDFTGFNHPSINDDLAVITLSTALPAGVPTYGLATSDMVSGSTHLYMVGYGQSGDGVKGYYVNASFTVKRKGENMADAFYTQDDVGKPAANEVFRFDFDGKRGKGSFGGPTLGNDKETTLGGGDSGGPSFVLVGSSYLLAGVNTFTQGFNAPKFGSLGGGINVCPYVGWINSILGSSFACSASSSAGGGGGQPSGNAFGGFGDVNRVVVVEPSGSSTTAAPAQSSTDSPANPNDQSEDGIGLAPLSDESLASYSHSVPLVVVGVATNSDGYHDSRWDHHDDILNAFDTVLDEMPPIVEG